MSGGARWESEAAAVPAANDIAATVAPAAAPPLKNGPNGSPSASSTASDSPTPTNSVQDPSSTWYSTNWQSLVSEEQAQLLGTEEESSDRQSDNEVDSEVFEMTHEQRDYYRGQFISLKPSADGLLSGNVARSFFEKSRLPVTELRKIWQLADVTKDGALSLDEFNIAMHLVVLRRNHIPLPDSLPPPLHPSAQPPDQTSPHRGKQWTKFVESPTNSVSSPGPKPVNFDFQKPSVEQDPKILHPVPLRVTPAPQEATDEPSLDALRPIQRPQPKKPAPGPGAIPPPPVQLLTDDCGAAPSGKKDPPPPPPPRPQHRSHTRSSSLDLTRLGKASTANHPPTVPPRVSPSSMSPRKQSTIDGPASIDFANFAHFATEEPSSRRQQSQQVSGGGAFQIYKKPAPEASEPEHWSPAEIPLDVSVMRREAANLALRRHCSQLQTSLAGLQEERSNLQRFLDSLIISHSIE